MVQKFQFSQRQQNDVVLLAPVGYLELDGGAEIKNAIEAALQNGILKFVVDFSKTELISSPGVAALLDLASRIVDDFNGTLSTFGLDKHHNAVLEMAGFFFLAIQAKDETSAMAAVQD